MKFKAVLALVILVVLAGAGYMVVGKRGPSAPSGGGNVFTSIKEALSKSLSLECSFTDETGRQTKAYMKAGAVRSDFTGKTPEESGSVIMKDKKMYFWNAQGGFMMEVPDEKPTPGQQATEEDKLPATGADLMKTLEQYKDSCKPAVVSDSLFTPPSNIQFQDFSKMMQQALPGAGGTNPVPTEPPPSE